jgi:hypothetical protein
MGTIVERPRGDGTTAFMAKIILKQKGKVIHRETQTFDRRPAASAWIKNREKALAEPGALDRVKVDDPPLKDVIDTYISDSLKQAGRTKAQVLNSIKEDEIAELNCSAIGSPQLVDFARRLARTREGSTVANYLSHLSEVFTVARPAWGYPLDKTAFDDAYGSSPSGLASSGKSNVTRAPPDDGGT